MNNELDGMWKEEDVCFELLLRYLRGRTEESHAYLQNESGTERPRQRSLYSGYATDWESEEARFDSQ